MSSESNTPVVVAPVVDVVVVEKKVKAPTLGAKHSRFMAFGHWFVSQQSTELVSEEVRQELYRKMMVFASLDEQTAFYEDFLTQVTATNKTIRKMVAASKKPVKAPKAPRAKKTKAALPQDGLVAQLIADANSSDVEAAVVSEPVAAAEKKPKAPRAKKPKVDAAAVTTNEAGEPVVVEKKTKAPRAKKPKAAAEPVANTVVEEASPELVAETVVETVAEAVVDTTPVAPTSEGKKTKKTEKTEKPKKTDSEKPKKTKKTKAEPAVATEEVVEDDIDTRMVTIADKDYLIDNNNNVYDMEPPHGKIGTFNAESGEVTLN
jgi:hypothetical protein